MLTDHVLFIDAEAIVIDKPAGLPVDPTRDGALSLENHLHSLAFGFRRWPTAVHRLDRDTSGCLLLARNPRAHRRLSAAFEAKRVTKHYLAVVDGVPEAEGGVIDMPLAKTSTREAGWRMVADDRGKPSLTRWFRVAVVGNRALVRFEPETGRTHQLRVHAASGLGLPIVGDPVYGRGGQPMLLHAAHISVDRDGKGPIAATAPLPATFAVAGFTDVG
jgi:tRNA pseudouridine32 synthase/23S rRNA pseudouridine746 synthase